MPKRVVCPLKSERGGERDICPAGMDELAQSIELMRGGVDLGEHGRFCESRGTSVRSMELKLPSGRRVPALENQTVDVVGRSRVYYAVVDESDGRAGLSVFLSPPGGQKHARRLCTIFREEFEGDIWLSSGSLSKPFVDYMRENRKVLVNDGGTTTTFSYRRHRRGEDEIMQVTTVPSSERVFHLSFPFKREVRVYNLSGKLVRSEGR